MAYSDPTSSIGHGKIVSAGLFQQLVDNLIAVAAGTSGAPSILPAIAAQSAYNGLGTYVLAYNSGGSVAADGFVAGSSLVAASAVRAVRIDDAGLSFDEQAGFGGGSLSGTWRAMGPHTSSASAGNGTDGRVQVFGVSLWVRIL